MKYKIVNVITGQDIDPVSLVQDLIDRGKLFRLPLLFDDEFNDLKIVPATSPLLDIEHPEKYAALDLEETDDEVSP